MKRYLKEIEKEIALCQEYIMKCDLMSRSSSPNEQEKLAFEIASDCHQTLSALAGEIEENDWISVDEKMPEEQDSIFAKFKGTDKWCELFWERQSSTVLTILTSNSEQDFVVGTGKTIDGEWRTTPLTLQDELHVIYWMPFPKFDPKE